MCDDMKPGPKSEWDFSLGGVKKISRSYPKAICDLLLEVEVKRLLNRMAIDPDFKLSVLRLIDKPKDG